MKKLKSATYLATALVSLAISTSALCNQSLSDNTAAKASVDAQLSELKSVQAQAILSVQGGVLLTESIRDNGAIMVNREGRRFVNELASNDKAAAAILQQTGSSVFLIFDDSIRHSLTSIEDYIALGIVSQGDSLEALGASLGIDAKALGASVAQYNRNVGKGIDFDFGRLADRRKDMSVTLKGKHFYAIEVMPKAS